MSSCIDVASEQLCYIPCNFCNIVLAVSIVRLSFPSSFAVKEKSYLKVSVPCSSLFDIVTVRCGHCTNLWSVNMAAAFQSLSWQDVQGDDSHPLILLPTIASENWGFWGPLLLRKSKSSGSVYMEDFKAIVSHLCYPLHPTTLLQITGLTWVPLPNATPRWPCEHQPRISLRKGFSEKRQRVPSAYNQFIKEEIQRIKANNPDISHREAFSTAAKNWAHFPHIHFGLMLETNNQPKLDEGSEKHLMSKAALRNK
ncbi:Protein YABBY 2 [Vitis vinifera]|uniref:Protein YABBY 2 n=1 Tax=Vitis vinifera TaxID=29760 RepID=A0A438JPM8_VITVI|nr:Protein YABBY 2 [Vitis vinifera]